MVELTPLELKVLHQYTSLCGNKSPGCVDCSNNNLIAIGSDNSIGICRAISETCDVREVVVTLNKHTGRVNCVKWIECEKENLHYLLSGSSDNTIICWACETNTCKFEAKCTLKYHTAPVTAFSGVISKNSQNERNVIFASIGADQSLNIWKQSGSECQGFEIYHTFSFTKNICLAINLHILPTTQDILLTYGCDDAKLYLNSIDKDFLNEPKELLKLVGHEEWIRDIKAVSKDNGRTYLASCSQDAYIRVWEIVEKNRNEIEKRNDLLEVADLCFTLPSRLNVLSGHDGWIYSLDWFKSGEKLQLLSASMDKSIIIWEQDTDSELWLEKMRCGDVGGNMLGFYGAIFSSMGNEVIAHSFNGAIHVWKQRNQSEDDEMWIAAPTVSGHFGSVNDIAWEPYKGRYLLSTSTDQTTRLFAKWKNATNESTWHEISRPQVHGYDLQCLAMINSVQMVSGADEKVLRVFNASKNFAINLKSICDITLDDESSLHLAEGATVPALGLSNKAVTQSDIESAADVNPDTSTRGQLYIENQFKKVSLNEPPTEEHLLQNTLWPEIHKLYTHVYEIFCVACSADGKLVASSAKSATPEHSNIVIWDTATWQLITKLNVHALTVTQMEFSNNSKYLLSVSRDRTWAVHRISYTTDNEVAFNLISKSNKKTCHTRIIWSCSWSHDDEIFSTASRDKRVMFWKINEKFVNSGESITRVSTITCSESVTSVAFAKAYVNDRFMFAIGKESGQIEIHSLSKLDYGLILLKTFDVNMSHCSTVKRLQWRPMEEESIDKDFTLASCSSDRQVKIFSIII